MTLPLRPISLRLLGALALVLSPSLPAFAAYPVPPRDTVRIGVLYALDPTCASLGQATVSVVTVPAGGQIETCRTRDYPSFPMWNVRARCDLRRVPVTEVLYKATPGFRGVDFVCEVVFPRGQSRR